MPFRHRYIGSCLHPLHEPLHYPAADYGDTELRAVFNALAQGPTQMTVRDALNSAMDEEMERDKDVFVLGEEVGACVCIFTFDNRKE